METVICLLPSAWGTEHLNITDSQIQEVEQLRDVFNACCYVEKWDPTFSIVDYDVIAELVTKSLSSIPDKDQQFRMQTIRLQKEKQIIGYFHLTHGSPKSELVFISMFVIHPDFQGQQYGQEVLTGLSNQLRMLKRYRAIWLDIYLKNWPALKFWVAQGFTKIIGFEGPKEHSETAHASLVLEKDL